jgi:hypothetical protein
MKNKYQFRDTTEKIETIKFSGYLSEITFFDDKSAEFTVDVEREDRRIVPIKCKSEWPITKALNPPPLCRIVVGGFLDDSFVVKANIIENYNFINKSTVGQKGQYL